jgi:hypothetical protein
MAVSVSDFAAFEIAEYFVPSITVYNRLEPAPRTVDFDRSLKAGVRDALWMLTRQWQFGEFKGEDAATAVTTKILGEHSAMNMIHFPGNNTFSYDAKTPLETIAEREMLTPDLSLAVQMGRYFIKLIKNKPGFVTALNQLIIEYPLNYQPTINDDEGIQLLNTVTGKVFDGFSFYRAIIDNLVPAAILSNHAAEIEEFKNWYRRNYNQPDVVNPAWSPSQLEYQFAVSSSAEQTTAKKLIADHYPGGHLDWYSFDIAQSPVSPTPAPNDLVKENIQSYIPTPVTFRGMPHPRFWMMEESLTDFGKIDTSPTGLLHLLLAEFGLTCSNDWFMLPYQLAINTLCEIKGILVKDVFGEYTLIRPAGKGAESQWQRWAMFHHTDINNRTSLNTNSFYLVPAVTKSLEGPALELVNFLRDEMANMVWAVENIVPSQAGKGVNGDEMALEKEEDITPASDTEDDINNSNKASIRYILGTTVPHNWIPFIPLQIDENSPEIQLQRARLPASKGASGQLLKEKPAPYFIPEEVIPKSGIQVSRTFQLARYLNGATCLWIGRRKGAGKGEGWSNLKFDQIENVS